ncbi:membrane protein [Novimethylophilus kurashikiensis]|uniref:Membrane protein n=1 Tax=Novimethylophilus kurashikiensis TaxID=1825523 RepID=A0A2R5F9I1_9PROT|nr:hypothetical protein [Novimethylophilus kurashikiensis]GBG14876.1 membrane protein [Novimethylophilus kurashikiensis]
MKDFPSYMRSVSDSLPVLFVSALMYHISRLLTLRHDGTGLPASNSRYIWILLGIYLFMSQLTFWADHGEVSLVGVVVELIPLFILRTLLGYVKKLRAFSGYLLIGIGIQSLFLLMMALGGHGGHEVDFFMNTWCFLAYMRLLLRLPKEE